MSNSASQALPFNSYDDSANAGGSEEVRWEIVARMPGLMPAKILAGRLQAEGIPALAWQEGAGQALGLTVGLLGTGYVSVPDSYVDQALDILADENEVSDDWDASDEVVEEDDEEIG
ncbi:MAG: hypothetical protein ACE5E7_08920 [Anaerolineae bacterium]